MIFIYFLCEVQMSSVMVVVRVVVMMRTVVMVGVGSMILLR